MKPFPAIACRATPVVLLGALLALASWLNPVYQDDGWYAVLGYQNFLSRFDGRFSPDQWRFFLEASPVFGFAYAAWIAPFLLLFGQHIFVVKAIAFTSAALYLITLGRFAKTFVTRPVWPLLLLVVVWPDFLRTVSNRPELFAAALGLLAVTLVHVNVRPKVAVPIAYAIPWLMFDAHSISVFMIFGFMLIAFIRNKETRLHAIGGGLAGLAIYLACNVGLHHTLGLFSVFISGREVRVGDHFLPITTGDYALMADIASRRFKNQLILFLVSFAWLGFFLKSPSLSPGRRALHRDFLLNYLSFLLLSSLFSEAVWNGFSLYSTTLLFLGMFILYDRLLSAEAFASKKARWLAVLPVVLVVGAMVAKRVPGYVELFDFARGYASRYEKFVSCMPPGGRVLMRPVFFVPFVKDPQAKIDFIFLPHFRMGAEKIGFREALEQGGYSHVVFDTDWLNQMLKQNNFADVWRGHNPYNKVLLDNKVDANEFQHLLDVRALVPLCQFEDPNHGVSTLYQFHPRAVAVADADAFSVAARADTHELSMK